MATANTVDVEYDYSLQRELGKSNDQNELKTVKGSWRPFKGSSSFSNSEEKKSPNVVVYRSDSHRSANFLMKQLQGLCKSPFIKPSFLHQSDTSCHLVGRKFDGDGISLKEWCKKHYLSFWRFHPGGGENAVSLDEDTRELLCQVLNGMHSYHERDISHGNLKDGIMITKENRVLFYNEQFTEGNVEGILSDIVAFQSILIEAVDTVNDEYLKNNAVVQLPPSYHALVALFGDLPLYQQHAPDLRKYEFFIRNNPLFLDITGTYLLLHKLYDYRQFNNENFDERMQLYSAATNLEEWYLSLTNEVLIPEKFRQEFQSPLGVILYIRDIYGHAKQKHCSIDNGVITQILKDEFPKLVPHLFLELVREFDQDESCSSYMCGRPGYSPYEFLKMDPGFT